MDTLKQDFLIKAEKYFDASVTDNEVNRKSLAVDMALLIRRERALYLAKRQPKETEPKPVEAQSESLLQPHCETHPNGRWLINLKTKAYYSRCTIGSIKNEECILKQ